MSRAWYAYIGGSASPFSITSYNLTVRPLCTVGNNICAIYAYAGGSNPVSLSSNLQTYIANALTSGIAQPAVPATAKKFVYDKTTT
jgi:hypothetical protein